MLKSILSQEICATCRICCNYSFKSLWDIPGFTLEEYGNIIRKYPEFESKGYLKNNLYYFEMNKLDHDKYLCPFLSDSGCILGDIKPFKCKIWPFYIINYGDQVCLAISNVCPNLKVIKYEELPASIYPAIKKMLDIVNKHPELIENNRPHFKIIKQLKPID